MYAKLLGKYIISSSLNYIYLKQYLFIILNIVHNLVNTRCNLAYTKLYYSCLISDLLSSSTNPTVLD